MQDLTLIIPTKKEAESLPLFLEELDRIDCVKLIVLQKEDLGNTQNTIKLIGLLFSCGELYCLNWNRSRDQDK